MTQNDRAPRRFHLTRRLLTATACVALLLDGCADEPLQPDPSGPADLAQIAPDASRPVAGPNGDYFASVVANGTGCPRGSWDWTVARDGISYEITHSRYEVTIADGQQISFKDCNTTFKLHSPAPRSFAVSAFQQRAYAHLESGVTGLMTGNYYFRGNPVPSADVERRSDMVGPFDRHVIFDDVPREEDRVWSPCSLDHTLQVVHRIGLRKTQPRGSGYITLSNIDGEYYGRLWLQLTSRPCAQAVDAGDAGRSSPLGADALDAGLP